MNKTCRNHPDTPRMPEVPACTGLRFVVPLILNLAREVGGM